MSRTPITLVLSIGLPLLFLVLLSARVGNEVVDERGGVRVVQYLAPGLASFAVSMVTFSFLAVGLAGARATGVVKRQAGTPAPQWVLVGGRIGSRTARRTQSSRGVHLVTPDWARGAFDAVRRTLAA
ncbi:hypothetical protein GCM10023153_13120 [Ornithinibacter aureus]|uniref:Uncharacterized protein n=1 Tax=Ornithinibacter aureus TaxID=622664 RepID=A0ABP8JMK2_9MICO|nr:hypothetical protein [Ornithinibacter aureus]